MTGMAREGHFVMLPSLPQHEHRRVYTIHASESSRQLTACTTTSSLSQVLRPQQNRDGGESQKRR